MKVWLIDTGPIVAYLDSKDPSHGEVAESLEDFSGRFVTTSAVITEAMHFLSASWNGPELLANLVAGSGMRVYDSCQPSDLARAAALMAKYADTPMDFADATLVLLGEALGVRDVFTLDRRAFEVFRTAGKLAFRIHPGAS